MNRPFDPSFSLLDEHTRAVARARKRVHFAEATVSEARADFAEMGAEPERPSLPLMLMLASVAGLASVIGPTLYEIFLIRVFPGDVAVGVAAGVGFGALIAASAVFGAIEAARSPRWMPKFWTAVAALLCTAGLFAARLHLSGGEVLVAAAWAGLEALVVLMLEGAALSWSGRLKRFHTANGPWQAAARRLEEAEQQLDAELDALDDAQGERTRVLRLVGVDLGEE